MNFARGASPSLAEFWETFTNDNMTVCVAYSPFRGSGARSRSTLPTELGLSDGRPESTYCGRSRSRPWTPQLGGERAFRVLLGKDRCPGESRHSSASQKWLLQPEDGLPFARP